MVLRDKHPKTPGKKISNTVLEEVDWKKFLPKTLSQGSEVSHHFPLRIVLVLCFLLIVPPLRILLLRFFFMSIVSPIIFVFIFFCLNTFPNILFPFWLQMPALCISMIHPVPISSLFLFALVFLSPLSQQSQRFSSASTVAQQDALADMQGCCFSIFVNLQLKIR